MIYGNSGKDSIAGGDGNDLLYGQGGDDTILGESGDDTIFGDTGNDSLSGGAGNDAYVFSGSALGSDVVDEAANADTDVLDFSTFASAVSVDLASIAPQVVSVGNLTLRLTSAAGIENAIGSAFGDQLLGNDRANGLSGTDTLDDRGGAALPWDGRTQVVFLDFDTETGPGEHAYTTAERQAILARIAADYAAFHYAFTLTVPVGVPAYATIFFNKTPVVNGRPQPGGQSDEFDYRNVNLGGTAAIDVNGFLGGPFQPSDTSDNFVAMSATIRAHELGHLVGLRHDDSFGPIGSGIHSPPGPGGTLPAYPGPTNAFETAWHIMATPASVGASLDDALGDTFFGEREAVKLALADDGGAVVPEQAAAHRTLASAQPLNLSRIAVPNTLKRGLNALKDFAVAAATVTASIVIDPATNFSESDFYAIRGKAGDLLNFEIYSTTLQRIANPIDSILRLYNSAGTLVNYYGGPAVNDDGFEGSRDSILIDVRLPADGTYYLEVDTFTDATVPDTETGNYELLAYRFDTGVATDGGDLLVARGAGDVLLGGLGNDTLVSGVGADVLNGGLGDDRYVLGAGGSDTLSDAGGRDTLDFSGSTSGVKLNLGLVAGQAQAIGAPARPWRSRAGSRSSTVRRSTIGWMPRRRPSRSPSSAARGPTR